MKAPPQPGGRKAATTAPPDVTAGAEAPSAQQLALTQLRQHLTDWMQHEPGARVGSDPEELHQLRVAVRRIEATLGLFKHQLPSRLINARNAAKGVLRALGAARDLDVQLMELRQYRKRLPADERAAAAPLEARLEAERARARAMMLGMLDSEATRHWLEVLNLASADFASTATPQAPRAATVMPERVRARFRKLRKAVRKLDAHSSMDAYHVVRRRAKQLRYSIECGADLFGKPAESILRSLRRLQDGLGAQQDAHMAKSRLAALAAEGVLLPPETLFLMGRLAEHHLDATREVRKSLTRPWRKVSGRRWKALRARMQELSDAASGELPSPHETVVAAPATPTLVSPDEELPQQPTEPAPLRH
jgi:CHAD domain-containing protein